jgi:acetyl-CoA carboxylase biotin carboxyl carrier protein
MDLRKLKTLIDLVSESNISELEITEAEGKVRIVKAGVAAVAVAPAPMAAPAVVLPAAAPAAAPVAEPAPAAPAASPGATPFADIGDAVKPGQAVCIIEAMKIMNEIESDLEGRIAKLLCENGQAVEFGQPLFVLE